MVPPKQVAEAKPSRRPAARAARALSRAGRSGLRRPGPVVADRIAAVGARGGGKRAESGEADQHDRDDQHDVHLVLLLIARRFVMGAIMPLDWFSDKVRFDATIEDQFRR